MVEQDRFGWKSFLDGFQTKRFRGIQEVYYKSNLIRKSSLKWKSDLQNRIWRIPWHMWSHRNHVLHQNGTTIHQEESQAIDSEIQLEYNWNRQHFLMHHTRLLDRPVASILALNINDKKQWLTSVYSARNAYYESNHDTNRVRNPIAASFFNQWLTTIQNGESQMLDEEIRQEYAWNPSHFPINHQNILATPITDILARSPREKKEWLEWVYSARDAYYANSDHERRVRHQIANSFYSP